MTNKIRGKVPSLISGTNGTPIFDVCGRKSHCCRCKDDIVQNSNIVKIPTKESGFTNKKSYCLKCFTAILEQTKHELEIIEKNFNDLTV